MSPPRHARPPAASEDIRPWTEDDDPAWIDWGLTAARGRMTVRVPTGEVRGVTPGARRRRMLGAGAAGLAAVALAVGWATTRCGHPGVTTTGATTVATSAAAIPPATTTRLAPAAPPPAPAGVPDGSYENPVAGVASRDVTVRRVRLAGAPAGRHVLRVVTVRDVPGIEVAVLATAVPGRGRIVSGRVMVRAATRASRGVRVTLRMLRPAGAGPTTSREEGRPVLLGARFAPVTARSPQGPVGGSRCTWWCVRERGPAPCRPARAC